TYSSHLDEVVKAEASFYVLKGYKPNPRARSLASIASDSTISNKELYFTTLYEQYKKLARLTHDTDKIKSCPAFHQTWVDFTNEANNQKAIFPYSYKEIIKENYALASFPELGLETSSGKKVIEYVSTNSQDNNKTVVDAIRTYNEKNHEELLKLCDTGVSENYFVFENMVSFYAKKKDFHQSGKALMAFMKMPLVSNALLIDRFSNDTDLYRGNLYRLQALNRL